MFNHMKPSQFINATKQIFANNRHLDNEEQLNSDIGLLQNIAEYVDDNSSRFSKDSPFINLSEALNNLDDIDDYDEDEVFSYVNSIYEYIDDISTLNLDVDDDQWIIQGNLSSSLRSLFDNDRLANDPSNYNNTASDWIAPKSFGLENSEPIVRTDRNIAPSKSFNTYYESEKFNASKFSLNDSKYESKNSFDRDIYENNYADSKSVSSNQDQSFKTNYKKEQNSASSFSNFNYEDKIIDDDYDNNGNKYNSDENNDDIYDDDNDSDDNDNFEDFYENNGYLNINEDNDDDIGLTTLNMSANLMAALGLDTSRVDTRTDWKPPDRSGLDNSSRLF